MESKHIGSWYFRHSVVYYLTQFYCQKVRLGHVNKCHRNCHRHILMSALMSVIKSTAFEVCFNSNRLLIKIWHICCIYDMTKGDVLLNTQERNPPPPPTLFKILQQEWRNCCVKGREVFAGFRLQCHYLTLVPKRVKCPLLQLLRSRWVDVSSIN